MMDILGQITISEVLLLFVLLFVLPGMAHLLLQLRRYESLYGLLPARGGKGRRAREAASASSASDSDETRESAAPPAEPDVYPYRLRMFLSPADKACLAAMREALGPEVDVYPKVATWELVEPSESIPGVMERLYGLDFDFLVCDRRTGQPLTAVAYNPGKGRPAGNADRLKRICAAAGCNVVFIDMAEEYDSESLKKELGIVDFDA